MVYSFSIFDFDIQSFYEWCECGKLRRRRLWGQLINIHFQ